MSNQMKIVVRINIILSSVALLMGVILFALKGFVFSSWLSYVALGVNALNLVVFVSFYIANKKQEELFIATINYYKTLNELRKLAILDFYKKNGLAPRYNKNGELMTPDEFLTILTRIDENGNLLPSVYEIIKAMPIFDSNGNEIPRIIVLKHLLKTTLKKPPEDLKTKLSGFYLKGSKVVEKTTKTDKKTSTKKEESKSDKKKSSSGVWYRGSLPQKKDDKKKDTKKKDDKPKSNEQKKSTDQPKEKLKENSIIGNGDINNSGVGSTSPNVGSDYLKKYFVKKEPEVTVKKERIVVQKIGEEGEATPE